MCDEIALNDMLGKILQKARQNAGLSQQALATLAGVDRSYISELECEHKSPTVHMLFRLCKAMEISAADVLREIERVQRRGKKS
jgi:transcriptional regulator with XRE-family HTH domain